MDKAYLGYKEDSEILLRRKKTALYWLLGTIYTAFVGLQLGLIQAIADYNYNLHEAMFLPINIALFLVPVELLIYMFFVIKCYRKKVSKQDSGITGRLKTLLIIASLIIIFSITNYQFHEAGTSGVFEIKQKNHRDGEYHIIVEDKQIRCTRNEYNLIITGKQYLIDFTWNTYSPNKGKLNYIEPVLK